MTRGLNALPVAIAIVFLGVAAVVEAQPATKIARIGWLDTGDPASANDGTGDFRQGLRDLKYIDGQNVAVDYRHSGGSVGRLADLAAELVRQRVDVIVTVGEGAALVARRATNAIPIVATELGQDPVKAGLVASLARPGANLTGLATQSDELWEKRLGLLRQVAPRVSRIAVIANPAYPGTLSCIWEIRSAAHSLGLQLSYLEASEGTTLQRLLGSGARDSTDAVAVCWDGVTLANARVISDFALQQRLPIVAPLREYASAGALLSFGSNLPAQRRRAAYYVDKILKGAKPADMPVERPTLFELVVNIKTARALGLTVPPELLILADEIVE
jgi:ABC-type uncharacterized transport system substrate-binding protein